eukprot:8065735-Pyramimonas_sp.AAC.1
MTLLQTRQEKKVATPAEGRVGGGPIRHRKRGYILTMDQSGGPPRGWQPAATRRSCRRVTVGAATAGRSTRLVRRENIPALPVSDWSIMVHDALEQPAGASQRSRY